MNIYTDGASRGNPGASAYAFIFTDEEDKIIYKKSEYLGHKTSNQAEMEALTSSLDEAVGFTRGKIKHFSDSKNVICWCNGIFCVRSKNIKPLFRKYEQLKNSFEKVQHFHVPRKNSLIKECDKLVNITLDKQEGKNDS